MALIKSVLVNGDQFLENILTHLSPFDCFRLGESWVIVSRLDRVWYTNRLQQPCILDTCNFLSVWGFAAVRIAWTFKSDVMMEKF